MVAAVSPAVCQQTLTPLQSALRPPTGPSKWWFGASAGAGFKSYRCGYCGGGNVQYDAVMVSARGGIQAVQGRLLLGAEVSGHLNGEARTIFYLATASAVMIPNRLVVGGGIGFVDM